MTKRYLDHKDNFGPKKTKWAFDRNDKRAIKELKKEKRYKKMSVSNTL